MPRDIKSLTQSIEVCQQNCRHLKTARKVELKVIEEHQKWLRDIECGTPCAYSREGLEHGIERARINLGNLDAAMHRERDAIKRFKSMIDSIHGAEAKKAEAQANLHIEVVRDTLTGIGVAGLNRPEE